MSVPSSILPPLGSSETEHLDRHAAAGRLERLAGAEDRGLDLEDVLRGLDDEQVDAALDAGRGLLARRPSTSSRKRILPSVGSSEAGRWPVGPIEPATKRSSPTALRAISAALRLISSVCSPRPHSSSFRRLAWKVSVSTTSAPASTIERVHALDDVGAVEDQRLVALARQARRSPPGVRSNCSSVAPMPPSKTTTPERTAAR